MKQFNRGDEVMWDASSEGADKIYRVADRTANEQFGWLDERRVKILHYENTHGFRGAYVEDENRTRGWVALEDISTSPPVKVAPPARAIEDAGRRPNLNEFFGRVGRDGLEKDPLDMATALEEMRKLRDRQLVKDEEAYRVKTALERIRSALFLSIFKSQNMDRAQKLAEGDPNDAFFIKMMQHEPKASRVALEQTMDVWEHLQVYIERECHGQLATSVNVIKVAAKAMHEAEEKAKNDVFEPFAPRLGKTVGIGPKVVHVYRAKDDSIWLWGNEEPAHFAGNPEYLGEYAPRGPVVREWFEVRWIDGAGKVVVNQWSKGKIK